MTSRPSQFCYLSKNHVTNSHMTQALSHFQWPGIFIAALCRVTRGRHRGVKIENVRLCCSPAEVLKTLTPSEKFAFFPHGAERCPLGRERESDGAAVHLLPLFSVSSQHFPSFPGCGKRENKQADHVEAATGRKRNKRILEVEPRGSD